MSLVGKGKRPMSFSSLNPVFLVQPLSAATFCVTYQSAGQGKSSRYAANHLHKETNLFSASTVNKRYESAMGRFEVLSSSLVPNAYPGLSQPSEATD